MSVSTTLPSPGTKTLILIGFFTTLIGCLECHAEIFARRRARLDAIADQHSSRQQSSYSNTRSSRYTNTYGGNSIDMSFFPQSKNTCWAAVSRSVINHHLGKDYSLYDLCEQFTDGYDRAYRVDRVLSKYGVYERLIASPSFKTIKKEIDKGDPVVLNVHYKDSSGTKHQGHSMLIFGYTDDGRYRVFDPEANKVYVGSERSFYSMVSRGNHADFLLTED